MSATGRARATLGALVVIIALAWPDGKVRAQDDDGGEARQIRLSLVNGTNGNPVTADKVTVFRLSEQMIPIIELESVTTPTTISGIESPGPQPVLVQVSYQGVNYNQPVRFTTGASEDVELTVYEATSNWDPDRFRVTTSRILYRRFNDRLSVDQVYVMDNSTEPPQTFTHPDGSFRFNLPTNQLLEMRSITASGSSGMPVPQQSFPVEGTTYATRTAFKPGETQLAISYDVSYEDDGFTVSGQAHYALDELLVLLAPADLEISGEKWEVLGPEPEGRFSVAKLANLKPGDPIQLRIFGGSREAGEMVRSTQTPNANTAAPTNQTITRLPDPERPRQWIVALLMAAALAYGLLSSVMAPESRRDLKSRLASLEARFKASSIPEDTYRTERKDLEQEIRESTGIDS